MPNVCELFSGDYEGAIDTLRMAITLIKQLEMVSGNMKG